MVLLWIWIGGALGVLTVYENDPDMPPLRWKEPLFALIRPITAGFVIYRMVERRF